MAEIQHPFHPQSLQLPGFVAQEMTQSFILAVFAASTVALVLLAWIFIGKYPHVTTLERSILCWWTMTGAIHIFVEGYFVFTPDFFRLKPTNFFAELWKEYSKGDSRYAGRDPAVVIVEGITAVLEGPLCFYVVYAVLYQKACRYTLQIAIALGQIYGCIVYFGTTILEKKSYSAPGFVYFWLYFVVLNNIWVVVPSLIARTAWIKINRSVDEATFSKKKKAL